MNARTKAAWAAAIGVPVLLLALAALQVKIDTSSAQMSEQQEELMLRSASTIKRLSLGYDSLLADIYWTRAVQYYGTYAGIPGSSFKLLWPLLDITTTLDPKLIPAYRFGAVFLSEPPPVGAGNPERAIELMKRGIVENPQDWQMNSSLAFLYYWYMKDYQSSYEAYLQGSKNPAAPGWVGIMAARMASKADAIDTSKMIWSNIYNSTTNESLKKSAFEHLAGLQALQDTKILDKMSEKYREVYGHYPTSIEALVEAGILRAVPNDPSGVPYVIQIDGKAAPGPASTVKLETPPQTPPH
jgi:hypothetical protein